MTKRANQLDGAEWLKNSFSIWRGLGRDRDAKSHPAPFPVRLASRLIESYVADADGLVLDPFAGAGSTLLAALRFNLSAFGFDINPAYRDHFLQRLSLFELDNAPWHYEIQDARLLGEYIEPGTVEFCLTSPPYWDVMNRRRSVDRKNGRPYSSDANDLGNLEDYGGFLQALAEVVGHVEVALRPGGYFVLNVMDLRRASVFYPLHMDASWVIEEKTGLVLEDIIIWDRQADYNSMRPLGYPHKFIVNKVHEYLLVFRRTDAHAGTKLDRSAISRGDGVLVQSQNGHHH